MIDFHSHILPGIDDGSQSVQQSLAMVRELSRQGVDTVVATSHFYADQRTPERFLSRRGEAWNKLKSALPEGSPRILLGAEVLYFPGMSHTDELIDLCTEGTNILLLEMPFISWTDRMIQEVHDMARSRRYKILMAHIERYYFKQDESVWEDFLDEGIHMQSNAEFFLSLRTRRKALKLLREGTIHFLGTDCHNMDSRRPRMEEAVAFIRRRLGEGTVARIDAEGRAFLEEARI